MNQKEFEIIDTPTVKLCRSQDYNSIFRKTDGFRACWGKTEKDDPDWCPIGNNLLDMEISLVVKEEDLPKIIQKYPEILITDGGCSGVGCKNFCYKMNGLGSKTIHMSLDIVKQILDKCPKTLEQIAFGICSINSHPQMWEIFKECRKRDIVPNVTVNGVGITKGIAQKLKDHCGAVAVSVNETSYTIALQAIRHLLEVGLQQTNIHFCLGSFSVDWAFSLIDIITEDPILKNLNAIVFLSYKDKNDNHPEWVLNDNEKYKELIEYCEKKDISFGMDSCAASRFLKTIEGRKNKEQLSQMVTKCESLLESLYINVFGQAFSCSFCENKGMWETGIDMLKVDDFIKDLWNSPKVKEWRKILFGNNRDCPVYQI